MALLASTRLSEDFLLVSGYAGTLLVIVSMAYSIRKRFFRHFGALRKWLLAHEVFSVSGMLLITVHSGAGFRTTAAFTAYFLMAVVVTSGFFGHYLKGAVNTGRTPASGWASDMAYVAKKWRPAYIALASLAFSAAAGHVLGVFYYGGA